MEFFAMKKAFLFIIPVVLALAGCLKNDLDPANLTSNPLDQDYDGPALIELVSDTTRIIYDGLTPLDTVVEQTVQVRSDLLAPGTDYALYVTKLNTGEVFDYAAEITPPADRAYHHVVSGVSYCYDYQLVVQFSRTKAYRFCTTANP